MTTRFKNEILKEYGESKEAEHRGPLHPHTHIEYKSRIHLLTENREATIAVISVITGFVFMTFIAIVAILEGFIHI